MLPAVIKCIYKEKAAVLADILSPIVPDLKGDVSEAQYAAEKVEQWLFSLGVTQKLVDEGFSETDVEKLTYLAFNTPSLDGLLGIAPNMASEEVVSTIYKESLTPYNK